jgi:hypothetical protein
MRSSPSGLGPGSVPGDGRGDSGGERRAGRPERGPLSGGVEDERLVELVGHLGQRPHYRADRSPRSPGRRHRPRRGPAHRPRASRSCRPAQVAGAATLPAPPVPARPGGPRARNRPARSLIPRAAVPGHCGRPPRNFGRSHPSETVRPSGSRENQATPGLIRLRGHARKSADLGAVRRHRPQDGLRVADEQDPMVADEERSPMKDICCHKAPRFRCTLSATQVQSSRKESKISSTRRQTSTPPSSGRYAPSAGETRERGAEALVTLTDLCGLSPGDANRRRRANSAHP